LVALMSSARRQPLPAPPAMISSPPLVT